MTALLSNRDLAESYELCRRLHARHGRSYYLATQLLPRRERYAVHALYGFARYIDDIVDVPIANAPPVDRLDRIVTMWREAIRQGSTTHPVFAATADTVRRAGIDPQLTYDFLDAMRQDLTVTRYADWERLSRYTWGSASVIGLQMAQVIGVQNDREHALHCATALGEAFQLTNFCRDYDEDRQRGRVYLPRSEFVAQGIEPGVGDSRELRNVIASATRRAHRLYDEAEPGIALLRRAGQPCIRIAFELYRGILDEIERADYAVIGVRHTVPRVKKLKTVAQTLSKHAMSFV
ncbi:phytoene synthase [Antricoccus suffuscus]|uniref:Phytoene synthase n=1 Tax=Antricoccus suffuscus TaxID=1629062 RepID=A0A2T0ZYF9_9ACTN|nr:phytoene/squalene synthase family protein [Antricoccus suffuscus]PRZ41391.1 phytoene synthase [Antricoccus suffuscus]